jgi:hypothetical protein
MSSHKELKLLCKPRRGNDIEPINFQALPNKVYKYFATIEHADNFLRGNIWIPGISQNRLCADPGEYTSTQKESISPSQIFTSSVSQILTLSLSLSLLYPSLFFPPIKQRYLSLKMDIMHVCK